MACERKLLNNRKPDILFEPNLQYYKNYAKHPFATTLAEELFQAGIIPSDTDFRNFRDYGAGIPG